MSGDISRLRDFVRQFTHLADLHSSDEAAMMLYGRKLLAPLVSVDDWLPEFCAQADPVHYRQYLLHCDPRERFSVVSFVWGPGQETPVHNHTVWGLIGLLRGAEISQSFEFSPCGRELVPGACERLEPGQVNAVSPAMGDIHRVRNGFDDRSSISVHVYGANIGAVSRSTFSMPDGAAKLFVSGYSNDTVPNLWDRSR